MADLAIATPEREVFAAYLCDDISMQLLAPLVVERGWSQDMIFKGGIAASVRALGAMPCPELLIVDLSECSDPRADVQALADVCEEGTIVLAIGTMNDVGLYRDLLNAGVHDYLVKPLSADLMRAALIAAEEALNTPDDPEDIVPTGKGKTIITLGVRGGVGTSTLAANLAWLCAKAGQSTALLDLDLYFGTSAMQFDLEPGRGLADALENPARVDGLFLERAVVKPLDKFAILCAEAPIGSMHQPTDGALEQLVEAMKDNYQNVIVDMPRHTLADHSNVLETASDIIVVTDYTLTSARDCIRLKAHLKNYAPSANVHMVANKIGSTPSEVEPKDFENSIEHNISCTIPFDNKACLAAAQKGTILSDALPNSKVSQAFKEISELFSDDSDAKSAGAKSWLGKLMKK